VDWYKVTIDSSSGSLAARNKAVWALEDIFRSRFEKASLTERAGAVMAGAIDQATPPTPSHFYYFSPEAVNLMDDVVKEYGGSPCPDPTKSKEVRYLAGDRGKYVFASDLEV
jgi:hypothetical protein